MEIRYPLGNSRMLPMLEHFSYSAHLFLQVQPVLRTVWCWFSVILHFRSCGSPGVYAPASTPPSAWRFDSGSSTASQTGLRFSAASRCLVAQFQNTSLISQRPEKRTRSSCERYSDFSTEFQTDPSRRAGRERNHLTQQ